MEPEKRNIEQNEGRPGTVKSSEKKSVNRWLIAGGIAVVIILIAICLR